MTESEMIKYQVDQIDRLISLNNWSVGLFITIIFAVIGFLGILQWRLSDKQIQSIKIDLEKSISEKYKLESVKLLEDRIDKQQRMLDKLINNVIYPSQFTAVSALSPKTFEEIQEHIFIRSLATLDVYEDKAPDDLVLHIISNIIPAFNTVGEQLEKSDLDQLSLLVDLVDRKSSENIKSKEEYIKLKDLSTKKAAIF